MGWSILFCSDSKVRIKWNFLFLENITVQYQFGSEVCEPCVSFLQTFKSVKWTDKINVQSFLIILAEKQR